MKTIKLIPIFAMFLLLVVSSFAASWSGKVVQEGTTTGVSGVTVDAILAGTTINSSITLSDGNFTVSGLTNGSYTLTFTKSGWVTKTMSGLPAINTSRGRTDLRWPFDIELTRALPGVITGHVRNDTSALTSAAVRVLQGATVIATVPVDGTGAYTVPGLVDGLYTVEASSTGYTLQQITNVLVQPNATTTQDFILLRGLGISLGPSASSITTNSALITWQTTVSSNTTVKYGRTTAMTSTSQVDDSVTSHSRTLTGLYTGTYYYMATSCANSVCVSSPMLTFNVPAPTTTPTSTSGSHSGGSGGTVSDSDLASGLLITSQAYVWDLAKDGMSVTKTIRPIDSVIFKYQDTSFSLIVEDFTKDGVIGLRLSPDNLLRQGYKGDVFEYPVKDKILTITIQEVNFDKTFEAKSTMKLTLALKDGKKVAEPAKVTTAVKKVADGVIKVAGEITPPAGTPVPVGIGISVATIVVGLLMFLGIRKMWN